MLLPLYLSLGFLDVVNARLTDNTTQILDFVNAQVEFIKNKMANAHLVLQHAIFVLPLHNVLNAQKIILEN